MKAILKTFFYIIVSAILFFTAFLGKRIYDIAEEHAAIKRDYAVVNSIHNGLFSVDEWRNEIVRIFTTKIDSFSFSESQETLLKHEIDGVLRSMVNEAQKIVNNQHGLQGSIKKGAINMFVDWDSIKAQIPHFSNLILAEVKKQETKESLKLIVQQKLKEYASEIYEDEPATNALNKIYVRYGTDNKDAFVAKSDQMLSELQERSYRYTYFMIAIEVFFLMLWLAVARNYQMKQSYFIICVLLGIVVLITSINIPMLEIDARIDNLDFSLMGDMLNFDDQVLFLQSKSILDVVVILVKTHQPDSILVGILILLFSILFPVAKLIATQLYVAVKKLRHHKLIHYLAFRSGKWSMADVMVIAIFMAFVGFSGILDDQLSYLNVQTSSFTSIATHNTRLQPGFALFLSFVIYSLILSELLKKLTLSRIEMSELTNHTILKESGAPWKASVDTNKTKKVKK